MPNKIYPPQFEFLEQKPSGFTLQVITPFAEITHFKAYGIVKSVVIHDGNGKHTVQLTAYASGSATSQKGAAYLTAGGKLASRLILKDSQSGFAGVTGYIWTIEPDGSWKRQSFLNRTIRKVDQIGKLSTGQLKQLAGVLKANRLRGLPARLGGKPLVNPKVLTVATSLPRHRRIKSGDDPARLRNRQPAYPLTRLRRRRD